MDLTHVLAFGLLLPITLFGMWKISRALRTDEAIDAATLLALKDLRARFERTSK